MNRETKSVIGYLKNNVDIVCGYFSSLKEGDFVSYSGLLSSGIISGTTEEGIDLNSSKVKRCEVTEYLLSRYSEEAIEKT